MIQRALRRFVPRISGRGRGERTVSNVYDTDWTRIDRSLTYPQGEADDVHPPLLADMLDIAAQLSAPFPSVRVDLYASATEIRVGELTLCPTAANDRLLPENADFEPGRLFGDRGKPGSVG